MSIIGVEVFTDSVRRLDLKSNGLAGESFHKDLHVGEGRGDVYMMLSSH